jgi:hypothetical protein
LQAYRSDALKGLKVEHDVGTFKEGRDVTLVIKDTGELVTMATWVIRDAMIMRSH